MLSVRFEHECLLGIEGYRKVLGGPFLVTVFLRINLPQFLLYKLLCLNALTFFL